MSKEDEFTSDFVAAKTCYGFEGEQEIIEFSGMRSECGLMEKDFLNLIGGWKFLPNTGSEEFELGHRITANGKKNYITKKTNYTTFYDNLYARCKTIVFRTSTYLPIFIHRKKFESNFRSNYKIRIWRLYCNQSNRSIGWDCDCNCS